MKNAAFLEQSERTSQTGESFLPVRICEIEIGEPLPDIVAISEQTGQQYQRARCLIRLHTQPLGLFELPLDAVKVRAEAYVRLIWQALREKINAHLRADGLPEVTKLGIDGLVWTEKPGCVRKREALLQTAPFVSVILSTHDRLASLACCLPSLLTQQYPDYEIIIVDNAPSSSLTADFIQQAYANESRIRYVREDRRGLSAGRNRGIQEARGDLIAFTDDDMVVDSYWLVSLVQGFKAAENVSCVTGLLLPLELETSAQFWLEEFGGFNRGFAQRVFGQKRRRKDMPLYPFTAGRFGSGGGMAFTSTFLREEKGFDLALGAGSCAGSGEDLAAFFQVIIHGHCLVYEPAALAYHKHHRNYANLQKQMYYYGTGLTAYLTKIVFDDPWLLFRIAMRVPRGLFFLLSPRSAKNDKKSAHFPKELDHLERKGMLRGPFLYLKGHFKNRKEHTLFQTAHPIGP